jgi:hypothetical protein
MCQLNKNAVRLTLLAGMIWLLSGCYSKNEEEEFANVTCDTMSMSYSEDVLPIINEYCVSCHGDFGSGNVSLNSYEKVKASAQNGGLLGSIDHSNGWDAMPQGQDQLDACTRDKIRAWINQGLLNN